MKKLIISSYDCLDNPYYAGGGARAVHEIAKRMQANFNVTVLSGRFPGAKNKRIDGVFYKRIGIGSMGPKIGQITFQLCLPIYALSASYVLWLENFTPPFSTGFIPLFTRKPVIGLVHMLASSDMQRKYKLPFHLVENLGLRVYKQFIVTQENTKKYIKNINPSALIEVIPNGVEIPQTLPKTQKRHILYLGRIEVNQKGLDLLLSAYKKALRSIDTPLVIAGGGEEKQLSILSKKISELNVSSKVTVVGRVEGQEKEKLLRSAHCVVVPSRFETFSMVSLESMAHGVPVIAFDIDGLSWVPDDASIKVKPYSTVSFAKALVNVVSDQDLFLSFRKNGVRFAKKLSWDNLAQKYGRVLGV